MKRMLQFAIVALVSIPVIVSVIAASGDPAQGKAVYLKRCKMCHGTDGQGNPAMARMLKVEFKAMESDYIQQKEDSEISQTIIKGKGKMAAVRGISEDEVADVIAYVRSMSASK